MPLTEGVEFIGEISEKQKGPFLRDAVGSRIARPVPLLSPFPARRQRGNFDECGEFIVHEHSTPHNSWSTR
jgi:hypothetical protein